MVRLFSLLAAISVIMVFLAGTGAFLISKTIIAQSKVDAVSSTAKGIALALSEQINLLNSMLDKMAQDPNVITAVAQNNPGLLANAVKELENHFPGILSIKFVLPDDVDINKKAKPTMSFADLDMAARSFEKNQPTAIQGEINLDRHLAIARRIVQNNKVIGVILAGVNYDFIDRILSATPLEKGYIELRQGKLVLATTGERAAQDEIDNAPVPVPNTDWALFYDNSSTASLIEFSLIVGIILIPALLVVLGFTIIYRKLSALLTDDVAWVMKAFKDILTEKPLGDYPVNFTEIKHVISTLAQFKRVVNDKWFEI